jgi:FHS family Na+ dependent glucose MFS transporter 1
VVPVVAFFFFYVGAEVGFGGWIYSYATAVRVGGDATAAYLTSVFWASLTAGRLLGIPIALRLSPRLVLLVDLAGALGSLGGLILWPHSPLVAWLGTCGMGLAMASVFPTMMCLAQRHVRISGTVTGWFFVGASGGGMVLPWLMGQLFESVGPRSIMLVLAVDLLGAAALLVALAFRRSARMR